MYVGFITDYAKLLPVYRQLLMDGLLMYSTVQVQKRLGYTSSKASFH